MMIIHFESCFSFYHWCDLLQRTTASNSWACLAFENSANFGTKRVIFAKGFKLNCLVDKVMAPSLVNDAVDCFAKGEILDPNISILVMNFENESDPFGAISNPLYQTTTFKQPNAIENGPYDYTRSEKSHSRCFRKLLWFYPLCICSMVLSIIWYNDIAKFGYTAMRRSKFTGEKDSSRSNSLTSQNASHVKRPTSQN
ncbi:cystathionine beta-lyase, chloroplastic-like [Arachis hypogaea]|uniref:cystathionine beta-lyase, chloroplastic n=1 Tax=Arachis hypogaea TaxID=3818 RepID=UPI000DECE156|nr:cystathionine beta-lyase, chloroplastic isoform X1 [Arachis hypogaea]XP_029145296.1 cystathionine beta-lyase, chloroplastic-like isoform X1 [Arachis hypogaea]